MTIDNKFILVSAAIARTKDLRAGASQVADLPPSKWEHKPTCTALNELLEGAIDYSNTGYRAQSLDTAPAQHVEGHNHDQSEYAATASDTSSDANEEFDFDFGNFSSSSYSDADLEGLSEVEDFDSEKDI